MGFPAFDSWVMVSLPSGFMQSHAHPDPKSVEAALVKASAKASNEPYSASMALAIVPDGALRPDGERASK
jgi:hypothetical protein